MDGDAMPENSLENMEFCIRKGIGVYCVKKYLQTEKN